MSSRTKPSQLLNLATTLAALAALLYGLFRPAGPVSRALHDHRAAAALRRTIRDTWPQLLATGGRLYYHPKRPLIVEFGDYECPYCRRAHRQLDSLLVAFRAGLLYLHFPLSRIHPTAEMAARASICAEQQNKFETMHRRLLETDAWRTNPDWIAEAVAAGIPDTNRFRRCLGEEATAARLARDRALAERLGVQGTPTFVSPAGIHVGLLTRDAIRRLIE